MPRLLRLLGAESVSSKKTRKQSNPSLLYVFTGTVTGFAIQCFRRELDVAQPRHSGESRNPSALRP